MPDPETGPSDGKDHFDLENGVGDGELGLRRNNWLDCYWSPTILAYVGSRDGRGGIQGCV